MNLDELKKSMSTLDEVLAEKSGDTLNFNTDTCNSAQSRVAKQYRKNILSCSVIAIVFIILWLSGTDQPSFPVAMKGFLGLYMAGAAIVYAILYYLIKKIQISTTAPIVVMKQVSSLRLYALIAEIILAIILAVFFTIFLSNLWVLGTYTFWLVAGALLVSITIAMIMLPKKIKDFNELTALD